MPRGQRTGRALSMHTQPSCFPVHLVRLDLREVVRDVVDQVEAAAGDVFEDTPGRLAEHLAVGEGVVGGRSHRPQVGLSLR